MMDREILFRGQTRKQGEKVRMDGTPVDGNWVYGGIFQGSGDFSIIYGSTDPDNISVSNIEKHVVHTDTVGQYTGLTDKNGKKIFEGDIIRWVDWKKDLREAAVQYNPEWNRLCVWLNGAESMGVNKHLSDDIEVIGDIHDNPKLLEGR